MQTLPKTAQIEVNLSIQMVTINIIQHIWIYYLHPAVDSIDSFIKNVKVFGYAITLLVLNVMQAFDAIRNNVKSLSRVDRCRDSCFASTHFAYVIFISACLEAIA